MNWTPGKLRMYMNDWDDNLLFMPTKIRMEKKIGEKWVEIFVSTSEFSNIRLNPDYRPYKNKIELAFHDFRETEPFLRDVKHCIENKLFGPSFLKFKESLIYANPVAINTARGHKSSDLKLAVKLLIDKTFTEEEKIFMVNNIQKSYLYEKNYQLKFLYSVLSDFEEKIIDFYLTDKVFYYTISSDEFSNNFKSEIDNTALDPKLGKKIAINDFIKKILNDIYKMNNPNLTKISFGYSEDDKELIMEAIEYIKKDLLFIYPNIHFVIYDNSNEKTNKIIINNYI